jgi:hypothetical protein
MEASSLASMLAWSARAAGAVMQARTSMPMRHFIDSLQERGV